NPEQLQDGPVLLVGAGNSGLEIAMDVVATHPTILSGPDVGHPPIRLDSIFGRNVVAPILIRLIFHRLLTVDTRIGRKVRDRGHGTTPSLRVYPVDLAKAGVERTDMCVGVRNGKPLLDDGRILNVANVIWCTGYDPDFSWI